MQPVRRAHLFAISFATIGIFTSAVATSAQEMAMDQQLMDQQFPSVHPIYSGFDQSQNSFAPGSLTTSGAGMGGGAMGGAIGSSGGAGMSSGTPGSFGNRTASPPMRSFNSMPTGKQIAAHLQTRTVPLDRVFGGGRALPPTRLDSFVKSAGGSADLIYGDEGTTDIPPFFVFDESHRIERGIHSSGLTTDHKSGLPDAWGWPQ